MGDEPKEPTSFNPREWKTPASTSPGAPTERAAAPDEAPRATPDTTTTSFNPKSWSSGGGTPPTGPTALPPKKGRGMMIGAAALVGVAVVGGGVWFATRGPSTAPASPTSPGAESPAAAPVSEEQRRALVVRQPGDILGALASVGVPQDEAGPAAGAAVAKLVKKDSDLTLIMMVKPVSGGNHLVNLDARYEDGAGVVVTPSSSGFTAEATAANLKTVIKDVRGEMDAYSFYSSAVAQHLTDSLISPFAQALTFDFDFQREIHAGDVFEAAFENRVNSRGETVGVGRLLYVSLETKEKSRALYWFQPPGGEGGWFDGNGRSTVRSLMRTPVEGARISSTFGMREHPVLGFMKMHKGVDFAAPTGTPIYAAGDGVVQNAEFKDLNGNYVKILHDNGWKTIYLHMSAFGPGIAGGVRVHQGQQIGAIGTTGRSTGPHLHYELHVNDEPVDPMSVPMENGKALAGPALQAFFKERDRIDVLRRAQTG